MKAIRTMPLWVSEPQRWMYVHIQKKLIIVLLFMCWMIKNEGATTAKGQFGPLGV